MKEFIRFLLKPDTPKPIEEPPKVVYDRLITERQKKYGELRQMVARLLYLKAKLEGDVFERRAALARLTHEARQSVKAGRAEHAGLLMVEAEAFRADLSHAEEELERIRKEANSATHQLSRFREVIRRLERERSMTEGALCSQEIRKALAEASGDFDVSDPRLDEVRAQVARIQAETSLEAELNGDAFEAQFRALPASV